MKTNRTKPQNKRILDILIEELNKQEGAHFELLGCEPTLIDERGRHHALNGKFVKKQGGKK
jgi:hypothetical protein